MSYATPKVCPRCGDVFPLLFKHLETCKGRLKEATRKPSNKSTPYRKTLRRPNRR